MYSRKNFVDNTTIQEHKNFLKLVSEKEYEKALDVIIMPLENFMARLAEGAMRI
jgi:F0F1-type ATP synthase delta subunit